jgi:outer membrane lipoprotein SlyB
MKLHRLAIIVLLLPAACSTVDRITGNEPIVDMKGVDLAMYDSDLNDCQEYANQVQTGKKVATSAGTGAVVGGVIGAVVGDSDTAKRGAGVGATTGALGGVGSGLDERRRVLRNCLNGRGYLVLN